jgi:hypothetical protein
MGDTSKLGRMPTKTIFSSEQCLVLEILINSTNADITHMEMDKKNFSISN